MPLAMISATLVGVVKQLMNAFAASTSFAFAAMAL
jgi:hypothetical protein